MSGAVSLGAVALAVGTGFATSFSTFAIVGILGATLGAIGTIAKVKELQYAGMALGAVGAVGGIASSLGAFSAANVAGEVATDAGTWGAQAATDAGTWAGTSATSAGTGAGAGGTAAQAANVTAEAATGSAGAVQGAGSVAAPAAATAAPEVAAAAVDVAEFGGQGGYDAINMVNGFDPSSASYASLDPSAASAVSTPTTEVAGTFQPDSLLNQQVGLAEPPPDVTVADFSPNAPTGTEGTMVADSGSYSGASSTDTLSGGTGTDTLNAGGSDSLRGGVQVDEYGNVAQGESIAPKPATQTPTSTQPAAQTPTQPAPQGDVPGLNYKLEVNPKLDAGQPGTWDAGVRATAGKTPSIIGEADIPVDRDIFDKVGDWAQKNQMLVYGGLQMFSGLGKGFFSGEGGGKQVTQEELDLMRAQSARNYAAERLDMANADILERRRKNMNEPAPVAVTGTPPWFGPEFRPPTGLINSPGNKVTGSVTV